MCFSLVDKIYCAAHTCVSKIFHKGEDRKVDVTKKNFQLSARSGALFILSSNQWLHAPLLLMCVYSILKLVKEFVSTDSLAHIAFNV